MYEEEENRWRCFFRSDGKWINVNELLQAFCGGGHAAAAGVRKRTNDVDKFRQEILERIVMMRKISGQNKELETKHRRTRRCRMMEKERTYIAIDLKSFYASVECKERNRDPLTTNLVVADKSRTEKTICLAVSPALKYYGIPGRARLFEVVQKVKEANSARRWKAPNRTFTGSSDDSAELNSNPALEIDYIVAPPRMALYLEYSTRIYSIYLKYIAPEDIFPYSIDEVFIDVTQYLNTYRLSARELAVKMIQDVYQSTGIVSTAGIGTNLY